MFNMKLDKKNCFMECYLRYLLKIVLMKLSLNWIQKKKWIKMELINQIFKISLYLISLT